MVRNLRPVAGLTPSQSVPVRFVTGRSAGVGAECRQRGYHGFYPLGADEVLDTASAEANPAVNSHAGVSGELQVLLPIDGLVNLDVLRGRLE